MFSSIDIDDCVNHECRNGATCVDGVANYTCACADGFIGARCEDGNAVNECMSNPCRNGGTCTDFKGYYTCSCSMLFTGVTCEHALSNSSASGLLRNLSLSTNSDKISEDSIDDVNSNFDESDDDDIDVVVKFDEALIKGKKARTTFHVYNTVNLFKEMNSTMKMNSKVISAKLKANGKDVTELGANNVTIIFKTFGIRGEQQCVYWNLSLNGGYGGWLTDGCASVRSDNAKITCVCNHLTNFAIIVNPTLDDSVAEILSIVIKVGLSLSIVCLGLVIVAFLAFRHLRRAMGQKVIVNMSAAISIYNLVFVAGMDKSNTYTGCIVVSAFLQYFLLASFMWVFMESLLQYKTLSYMQKPGPRFLWVCLIAAWGIPLIPVIFFLALNHDMYYGDKGYCWFGPRNVGYALVIPLGAIVLANIVILALLAMRLCRWPAAWIFSYLSVENTHLAFHYLFAILSAIIGVLIFVLFVTRDREVRKSWNRQCCKQPKVEIIPPSQIELERKIQFEESLQRKVAYSEQIRAGNSLYPKTDNPYRSMFNNSYGSRADNSNLARVDVSGQPMFDIPYKDMVTDSGQVHVVYSNRSKGSNSSQFKGENPDLSKEDRGYTPFNVVGSGY
ncbi:adhesion G-protein coupled receptor G2-like [Dreissena polymorpha]|uniref:adhesion G-protein coupled receptor G2-like n=1 Tax=Dreissena polymorpha TaxID=45954 RepID=UPI0022641F82|nr:adhesion G-protein coupled receptor G2-like [Dreissena polymorpha]